MQGLAWLDEAWAKELSQVLELMTAEKWEVAATGRAPALPADLWWRQTYSHPAGAPLWAGASEASWTAVGVAVLRAAGMDAFEPAEVRATFLEIVHQSLTAVSGAIAEKAAAAVEPAKGSEADAEAAAVQTALSLAVGDVTAELVLAVSPAFQQAFAAAAAPAPVAAALASAPAPPARPMDFLLDVELPVSISFGHARLCLKDVLKLSAGAVVELDSQPEDAVDVIVNNTVVARGEVVVVEGNYGVRITNIVNRSQRLALRSGLLPQRTSA